MFWYSSHYYRSDSLTVWLPSSIDKHGKNALHDNTGLEYIWIAQAPAWKQQGFTGSLKKTITAELAKRLINIVGGGPSNFERVVDVERIKGDWVTEHESIEYQKRVVECSPDSK